MAGFASLDVVRPGDARGQVVFVSCWYPYPPDNGSKIRVHALLKALASRYRVSLVTFGPADANLDELAHLCSECEVVVRDPFRRRWLRAMLGWFLPLPRSVFSTYSARMARAVRRAVTRSRCAVVIASTMQVAPYVIHFGRTPKILEEHNFGTRMMWEHYRSAPGGLERGRRWVAWRKTRRYERWAYPRFDVCTMVSVQDRQAVLAEMPALAHRVELVPNGVDMANYASSWPKLGAQSLVFNGAMTYRANYDAVAFFLRDVFPLIRGQLPNVRLSVTGSTEGVDVASLALDDHVTLTGYVTDIRPLVAGAWVCVVPLRAGGGTRLKILEAMALGTPVVSTSKGAEGLAVTPEQDILIADTPAGFAAQTVRLLRSPELRARLARNGRRLVEVRYDWQRIGQKWLQVVETVMDGRRAEK